jgi:cytidylate kinase
MYRALTVAREFGSGGGHVAAMVAERLHWRLLDSALISEIARAAKVDPDLARKYDEQVDSWVHRVSRRALWRGAFEGVAIVAETEIFDAETVRALSSSLIREACEQGDCVIVGRGGQCVLQDRKDVFHVFIYAPWNEKVARIRKRMPDEAHVKELIESTELARTQYVRLNFDCNRTDPHLYHMLISSALGEDAAVAAIVCAMNAASEQRNSKA